jgi:hypothetical protein
MILAISLSTAGCGPFGWTRLTLNRPLDAQDVVFITPGKTTWREVMQRLGAPSDISGTSTDIIANYYYYDGKFFSIDFLYGLNFFAPASAAPHSVVFRNAGFGPDTFQVAFDDNGVVEYKGFAHGSGVPQYRVWPFSNSVPW